MFNVTISTSPVVRYVISCIFHYFIAMHGQSQYNIARLFLCLVAGHRRANGQAVVASIRRTLLEKDSLSRGYLETTSLTTINKSLVFFK